MKPFADNRRLIYYQGTAGWILDFASDKKPRAGGKHAEALCKKLWEDALRLFFMPGLPVGSGLACWRASASCKKVIGTRLQDAQQA